MPDNAPVLDEAVIRVLNAFANGVREALKQEEAKVPIKRCKYLSETTLCNCKECVEINIHNCSPSFMRRCSHYEPVDIEREEDDTSTLRLWL